MKILIECGVDLNKVDKKGTTGTALRRSAGPALLTAIAKGQRKIAKLLLENNADIKIRNKNNYSCLFMAAFLNEIEIVHILIEKGAKVKEDKEINGCKI